VGYCTEIRPCAQAQDNGIFFGRLRKKGIFHSANGSFSFHSGVLLAQDQNAKQWPGYFAFGCFCSRKPGQSSRDCGIGMQENQFWRGELWLIIIAGRIQGLFYFDVFQSFAVSAPNAEPC
jgi:hypothetical protein